MGHGQWVVGHMTHILSIGCAENADMLVECEVNFWCYDKITHPVPILCSFIVTGPPTHNVGESVLCLLSSVCRRL